MIAMLRGEVVAKHLDRAVILAGSMGGEVFATPDTLASWQVGETVDAHTYLIVREDALTLYGFASTKARAAFAILMQVKGIGPKLGLAALSVLSPTELATAVAARDLAALQRIPGVGKKSAERMAIEIGDKLGVVGSVSVPLAGSVVGAGDFDANAVIEALVGLGWSAPQASEAVSQVQAKDAGTALREALQYLGGKHG